MNATDVEPSRLEYAKEQAKIFVRSLTDKSFFSIKQQQPQVMVITISENAKVVCNFTSDTNQLVKTIGQIAPSDGGTNLEQGLVLARAFCQSPDPEANNRTAEQAAKLVLFSDGRISDSKNLTVAAEEMLFQAIGDSSDNVAITTMKAKRSFENAEQVNVFATVANYNDFEVVTDLQLSINDDLKTVKTVRIPPMTRDVAAGKDKVGQVSVDFEISSLSSGVIGLKLLREDSLAADDTAWSVISAPRDIKVLLVSNGNAVLETALTACRQVSLFKCSVEEFAKTDQAEMGITRPYDIVVLDNHDGMEVGLGCYLVFGKVPDGIGVRIEGQVENQIIVDYRAKHPVLNYVNMENLFAAKCYKMELPRDGEVLAEFNETAAVALLRRNNSVFVLAGFDVMETNWPFEPSFVLFIYNATAFLAENAGFGEKRELKAAEPVIVDAVSAGIEAFFSGPGYENEKIIASQSSKMRLPIMERVGLYTLETADSQGKVFAVNLLNSEESDIEPKQELTLSGRTIEASDTTIKRFNMPIWPYIVMVILLLTFAEWYVYNSKIRI
jgi:hypothetical protein